MSTRQMNGRAFLAGRFARSAHSIDELMLLDVGASGGIDGFWAECFGPKLKAVGFDPLITEVERLNKAQGYGGVRYEAALIGSHDYDVLFPPSLRQNPIASKDNSSFQQTSAVRASEAMRMNYVKE